MHGNSTLNAVVEPGGDQVVAQRDQRRHRHEGATGQRGELSAR